MRRPKSLCLVLALALALPLAAAAEEGPVTWVSFVTAHPGQSNALSQYLIAQGKENYDPLVASGDILVWGVGQPITHTPDQNYTHGEWAVFANWAAVDKFVQAFMTSQMAKSPEEMAADQEKWLELVVAGSHFDMINRGHWMGGSPAERVGYLNLVFIKEAEGADFMQVFDTYAKPVLEKASADGAIGTFGVDTQEIHGDHSWTHLVWYEMPGLGARDAVEAGWAAHAASLDDAGRKAMREAMDGAIVPETHWDEIVAVLHYSNNPAGGEGGEAGESEAPMEGDDG